MTTEKGEELSHPASSAGILIVSKNLQALRAARAYLASEGYAVMTASSLTEATGLCQKHRPRLFILDADFSAGLTKKILDTVHLFFHPEAPTAACN